MDCLNMSDDKLVHELREDIKGLTEGLTDLRLAIVEMTGKLGMLDVKIEHKADKGEIDKLIAKEFTMHEIACNTRKNSNQGMTPKQKATVVGSVVTAIATTLVMIFKNI